MEIMDLEAIVFSYMDKVKQLISPEIWENILLDCSKNELFSLLFVYRKKEVNMTQIAEYIQAPLNTATGIVTRLEKKKLLKRMRSDQDKRVVTVSITEDGIQYIGSILKELWFYVQKIMEHLTAEEMQFLFHIFDKAMLALEEANQEKQEKKKERKIQKIMIE